MSLLVVFLPFDSPSNLLTDKLFEEALSLVDAESQAKVKRFYRREDAWRGLTGQLLLRYAMEERGVSPASVVVRRTKAGKPYIEGDAKFSFNISHDNAAVILACGDEHTQDIGVDVMKLELPRNETISSFAEVLHDQLSENERTYLAQRGANEADKLSDIFLLWTLKEAYSKALGLGLSFDFSLLDYDFASQTLSVDGNTPIGWHVHVFDLAPGPQIREDKAYRCCLAQKLKDTGPFRLSRGAPPVRYLDISTLVAELKGS